MDRKIWGLRHSKGDVNVGCKGVRKMIYHEPVGEGDRHYVDIYTDEDIARVFDILWVSWSEDNESL